MSIIASIVQPAHLSHLCELWHELLQSPSQIVVEASLKNMALFLHWIGVSGLMALIKSSLGSTILSMVHPNAREMGITLSAWSLIHDITKHCIDLESKLAMMVIWPVADSLRNADTTSKQIGTAVAAVAATLGKDMLLCWRVFGIRNHPLYATCESHLLSTININLR
jgi:hypothetical protein